MKHLYYKILLLLCCTAGIQTTKAQDVDKLFAVMPTQYLPYLDGAWRKDLIELYNSGKEAKLRNTMNGHSTLKKLTKDYLLLQTSDRSKLELKLLPLVNNTSLICMVKTVYGPVADSNLRFFTTDWKELEGEELFMLPTKQDFVKQDVDKKSLKDLDIDFFLYELSAENNTLSIHYTTPEYLGEEMKKEVKPLLKKGPLVLTWDKFRFKR